VDCFGGTIDFLFILEGITVLLLFDTAVVPVRLVFVDCKSEVGLLLGVGGIPFGDAGALEEDTMDFLL
jgi:hypothetical protein